MSDILQRIRRPPPFLDVLQRMRRPAARAVGSTMTDPTSRSSSANNNASSTSYSDTTLPTPPVFDFAEARRIYTGYNQSSPASNNAAAASSTETRRLNIHSQLMTFIENQMFKGKPITDENMHPAINRAVQWFGESLLYLPQYEKPEYDSRDSLFNILRSTLPIVIKLMNKNPVNLVDFEQKLREICEQFRKRLYSVLIICIGRDNADIYWSQLMRLLCVSIQSSKLNESIKHFVLELLKKNVVCFYSLRFRRRSCGVFNIVCKPQYTQ